MRGRDDRSGGLFSYVRLEERVRADHPLRPIRALADEALAALNGRFEGLYGESGLAFHFVAEDRDGGEVGPERELVRREQRAACDREILRTAAAPERGDPLGRRDS